MIYHSVNFGSRPTFTLEPEDTDSVSAFYIMAPVIKRCVEACMDNHMVMPGRFCVDENGNDDMDMEHAEIRRAESYGKIVYAMDLIIRGEVYSLTRDRDEVEREIQDGFDELAKVWRSLWT